MKLHRFHLTETDIHRQPLRQRQADFRIAGALPARFFQYKSHGVLGRIQLIWVEIG